MRKNWNPCDDNYFLRDWRIRNFVWIGTDPIGKSDRVQTPRLFFRKPAFQTTVQGRSIWAVPFPGSDKSVVQRSQYFNATELNQKPVRFQPYLEMPSFFSVVKLVFCGLIFSLLTKFKLGIQLLLKVRCTRTAVLERSIRFRCSTRNCFQPVWSRTKVPLANRSGEASPLFVVHRRSFSVWTIVIQNDVRHVYRRETETDPWIFWSGSRLSRHVDNVCCLCDRSPARTGSSADQVKETKGIEGMFHRSISFRGGVLTPGVAFARTSLKEYLQKNGLTFAEK